ncbi:hypothetical protein BDN72DRAFT_749404, partial [Pluteus cervinus]
MSSDNHTFLFTSLSSKEPSTARKLHIRRLCDLLYLSIQRNDYERAKRAWCILARCKEFKWMSMWKTALCILGHPENGEKPQQENIEFLRTMLRQYPQDREQILQELIANMIHAKQYRDALDELDLYLPSLPYQDNATLNLYAGLISLYLAQGPPSEGGGNKPGYSNLQSTLAAEARSHFEHARNLDPDNPIAQAFIDKAR